MERDIDQAMPMLRRVGDEIGEQDDPVPQPATPEPHDQ